MDLKGCLLSFTRFEKWRTGRATRARRVWGSCSGGGLRLDLNECLLSFLLGSKSDERGAPKEFEPWPTLGSHAVLLCCCCCCVAVAAAVAVVAVPARAVCCLLRFCVPGGARQIARVVQGGGQRV